MVGLHSNSFLMASLLVVCVATAAECSTFGKSVDEAAIGDESGACPTTLTTTTTFAVSLMQAASVRDRLGSSQRWDAKAPQALDATASVNDHDKEGKFRSSLKSAMAVASSLVREGQTVGRSALGHLAAAPQTLHYSLRSMTRKKTGIVILGFTLTFIIIMGIFAYVLLFRPSLVGMQTGISEADAFAKGGASTRAASSAQFHPLTSSPQVSLRAASPRCPMPSPQLSPRVSPQSSQKNIVMDNKAMKLAPTRGDTSIHRSNTDEGTFAVGSIASTTTGTKESFCPDLVVPNHCECILVLPLRVGNARSSFNITDVNGSPVLRATPQAGAAGRPWRASVSTAAGVNLVQCCEVRTGASGRNIEFHLLRADGRKYGTLVPAADRYTLIVDSDRTTAATPTSISFWGKFEEDAVNITDDANRLLAITEVGPTDFDPRGKYCRLRVVPLADVGMALCGLLCIGQHMLMKRSPSM